MSDLKKYQQKFSEARCCVLIPTYNNARSLGKVIEGVFEYTPRVIVVNDGSTDDTADILSQFEGLDLITLPSNKGKGYAIRKGFQLAREQGYKYAITLDSDGQLMPQDLPVFLEKLEKAKKENKKKEKKIKNKLKNEFAINISRRSVNIYRRELGINNGYKKNKWKWD